MEIRYLKIVRSCFLIKFKESYKGFKIRFHFIAGRPKTALLFWFFMFVLLSICLWSVSIVATCIASHFALCPLSCFIIIMMMIIIIIIITKQKIGKNRC